MKGVIAKVIVTAFLSSLSVILLFRVQGALSIGDILVVSVLASFSVSILRSIVRNPCQFLRAIFERIRYIILVPICGFIVVAIFLFRIGLVLFKLTFKLFVAALVGVIYLISPVDLIPDIIPVLGQIDDILLIVTLAVWGLSFGAKDMLKTSISILRPTTPFP